MILKKSVLILIVIVSVLRSVDAQWDESFCGVSHIDNCSLEEFNCMWERASKIALGGAITTIVGTSLVAVSAIISFGSVSAEISHAGNTLSALGILIDIIGVPIWITGASRKSHLRKIPHYNSLNLGSLRLAPTINRNHFNNTYAFGLTATLKF